MQKQIIRVSDILKQIESLNKMIELHQKELANNSMLSQYEYMKNEFVKGLAQILYEFKIQLPTA